MADSSRSDVPDVEVDSSTSTKSTSLKELKNDKNEEFEERDKIKKQATLLFLQGKRSVYIRDFQGAIAALSESCQLFSKIYPEHDEALADPYFYYGKALLEVGRSESEVLGDQMQEDGNGGDDDDEDEDEEEEENDEENEKNNMEKTDKNIKANGTNGVNNGEQADSSTAANENPDGTVTGNDEGDNEDINDLQLSWEYLELAKWLYEKKASTCKETAIKLAETYLCLGENGLESENYSVAVEDINKALELQKIHLQNFDRRIAETYYQLGIAHSLGQNYDEAIVNFNLAIEQLNKKISSLELRKQMGDKKTAEEEKDAFYTMDGEIKEIQTVIKEIEEKIKDMHECKNQVKAELLKQVISSGNQPGASSSPSSNIQPTDISHLIKKKRKNDDEDSSTSEKKTKLDQ